MRGKIDGKVAVVTGAAMGNGEGIAQVLAKHGAHVVLWDISEKVFDTAESLKSKSYKSTPAKVDVTNFEACQKAADDVIANQGSPLGVYKGSCTRSGKVWNNRQRYLSWLHPYPDGRADSQRIQSAESEGGYRGDRKWGATWQTGKYIGNR
jgi:NAD(P)-dependent dehydrogenase (short-subunit alcohol dehydrogenase family)